MNIITVSREFGSGGRELGKRIADLLGYDYYDSEIISAVAQRSGLDEDRVAQSLANQGWQTYPITFRGTLRSAGYVHSSTVPLLLKQKEVIEQIAALGRDFVIIGRNADVILQDYQPFNVFVCAEAEAKVKRCMERRTEEEALSEKELIRKMRQIDKMRADTRTIISGSQWGRRDAYHLTVNTTFWDIKALAPAVADFAKSWFGRER